MVKYVKTHIDMNLKYTDDRCCQTMKLYGIYEKVVGVPASSLSQLRGPWPENVEDPWYIFNVNVVI